MTNYLIAVNYDTSELVDNWFNSEYEHIPHLVTVIIDNFSTDVERLKVLEKCKILGIYLVESENIGYGAALNKGLAFIASNFEIKDSDIIMMGNIDIEFNRFCQIKLKEPTIFMPTIIEKSKNDKRNRNPFLTNLQSKMILFYKRDARNFIWMRFVFIVLIVKMLGFFKSKPYAVHGSMFCFNGSLAKKNTQLFNEKSFLYCEEIDFAKFIENYHIPIILWNSEILHIPHASTFTHYSKASSRTALWQQSFTEYLKKWT